MTPSDNGPVEQRPPAKRQSRRQGVAVTDEAINRIKEMIVSGVLQSVPPSATGAASGVLTTTQQFSMTLGIAAVGTLFFAREASAGIVSALQAGLYADTALVAFALVMTLFLPRTATTRSAPAPVLADGGTEGLVMFDGAI